VLKDRKDETCGPVKRCFAGEVKTPDKILGKGLGPGVLDPALLHFDFVAVPPQEFPDEGLAYGHLALVGEAPVEDLGDPPASTVVRHQCFEADDFPPDPGRFGLNAKRDAVRVTDPAISAPTAVQPEPGEAKQMQDENNEQCEHDTD
jgi:hypothetical protein